MLIDYVLSIVLGVLSSLVASLVYLYIYFQRLKPHIAISEIVGRYKTLEGGIAYNVKVINKGKRSLTNVKAELLLCTPRTVPKGIIVQTTSLSLRRAELLELAGFRAADKEAKYAFRFRTMEDLDVLWKENSATYLVFRVFAADSLSGLGSVFTQTYYRKADIKTGEFGFGNTLTIE